MHDPIDLIPGAASPASPLTVSAVDSLAVEQRVDIVRWRRSGSGFRFWAGERRVEPPRIVTVADGVIAATAVLWVSDRAPRSPRWERRLRTAARLIVWWTAEGLPDVEIARTFAGNEADAALGEAARRRVSLTRIDRVAGDAADDAFHGWYADALNWHSRTSHPRFGAPPRSVALTRAQSRVREQHFGGPAAGPVDAGPGKDALRRRLARREGR